MARDYNISKTTRQCAACDREFELDEDFVAMVAESGDELCRRDFCTACWEKVESENRPDVLGTWRSRVSRARDKKKLLVDDELLVNFFQRLAASEEPVKVNFRFILALVLMRKKMLVYDRSDRRTDGAEVWTMHFRGSSETHEVIDPHMDEEKIAEVSRQLNQIMEGDL